MRLKVMIAAFAAIGFLAAATTVNADSYGSTGATATAVSYGSSGGTARTGILDQFRQKRAARRVSYGSTGGTVTRSYGSSGGSYTATYSESTEAQSSSNPWPANFQRCPRCGFMWVQPYHASATIDCRCCDKCTGKPGCNCGCPDCKCDSQTADGVTRAPNKDSP